MSFVSALKKLLWKSLPWAITLVALYYAFHGVDWQVLLSHVGEARRGWLGAAVLLTCASYLLRSLRWQSLFPQHTFHFLNSARVLFLGFFMNNVLPARAGELVRAHMGARLAGQTRTLVLATIASERLVDGLTISLMFVVFALGIGDSKMSRELLYVAYFFAAAGAGVVLLLAIRNRLISMAEKLHKRFNSDTSSYAFNRMQVFINGLSPLTALRKVIPIAILSIVIWSVELAVYRTVSEAFSSHLTLPQCVLFMVAVNFASLIPAAPGGVGVIEAIASVVLVSIGIEKEQALTMVIAQHVIQYIVVGIPGALIMFNWKNTIRQLEQNDE